MFSQAVTNAVCNKAAFPRVVCERTRHVVWVVQSFFLYIFFCPFSSFLPSFLTLFWAFFVCFPFRLLYPSCSFLLFPFFFFFLFCSFSFFFPSCFFFFFFFFFSYLEFLGFCFCFIFFSIIFYNYQLILSVLWRN